jgi:hypothetical protein
MLKRIWLFGNSADSVFCILNRLELVQSFWHYTYLQAFSTNQQYHMEKLQCLTEDLGQCLITKLVYWIIDDDRLAHTRNWKSIEELHQITETHSSKQ